jgi:glutathione reductase (NADPH)
MAYDYDLFVIGAGSGGVRASRIAASHGARVGICEDYRVGGTCVIRGCVPKKLLMYGSKFAHEFEDAAAYGWTVAPPTHSWTTLRDNVNREVDRLNAVYLRLLDGAGVKLHMGRGRLMDRHTIQVGEETITAEKILIATGGHPVRRSPAANWRSPRTTPFIFPSCPSTLPSSVRATLPSNSPASSAGSAPRSISCCGATASCVASMRSAAPSCTKR